jgi:CheY-like chemotaxis protein
MLLEYAQRRFERMEHRLSNLQGVADIQRVLEDYALASDVGLHFGNVTVGLGKMTAVLLIGGREVAIIFADVRLRGVMDGIDLAREVKMRWPLLPVMLTSGHPRERVGELPPGVAYMPKPWQPLSLLIAAEQALASRV